MIVISSQDFVLLHDIYIAEEQEKDRKMSGTVSYHQQGVK